MNPARPDDRLADSRPRKRGISWFWSGFLGVIGLGVIFVVFALVRSSTEWAVSEVASLEDVPPPVVDVIQVTLAGGEPLYIDTARAEKVREDTRDWLTKRQSMIQQAAVARIDEQTEAIYQASVRQVPAFAEWYYTLGGEYARLFHAAAGDLSQYLAGRLQELVFEPAGSVEAIDRLVADMDVSLAQAFSTATMDLQDLLTALVELRVVPQGPDTIEVQGEWALGPAFAGHLSKYASLTPEDIARQGLATSAGAGVSAAVTAKLGASVVAKTTAKMTTSQAGAALAAAGAKAGLKATGGAGAGAATGALLCAGSGVGAVVAPGCALIGGAVAGIATWIAVDKTVIEAEELLLREDFEAQLRSSLEQFRDELRVELKARYRDATDAVMVRLTADVGRALGSSASGSSGFVPANAGAE